MEQCVSKGLAPSLHLKKEGNDDQRVAASPEIGNVTPNLWMDLILQQGRSEAFLEQFTPTARGAIPSLSSALLSCPQVAPPSLTPSFSSASPSQQVMVIMMLQKGVISHCAHELFERDCLVSQARGEVAIYPHS